MKEDIMFYTTAVFVTIAVILLIGEMSGIIDRVIEGI